ncbi:hypothetical protein DYU11_25690 [Fibrisoma montanum]|uniref:Uncharacterized protein n=1 Tax=Fibrisoma montanum TaxID=2305895 RepID=A0A418M1B2_9BACT|nr:hypothetical protein DYU11_25690 [Fibrisoma montanum]
MAKNFKASAIVAGQAITGGDPNKTGFILDKARDVKFRQALLETEGATYKRLGRQSMGCQQEQKQKPAPEYHVGRGLGLRAVKIREA